MTVKLRADPKHEHGAYIEHDGKLYCVEFFERTGPDSGMLHAVSIAKDGETLVRLTAEEVGEAKLIKPAPPLVFP